jgi:cation diffusion facilitator family transporter
LVAAGGIIWAAVQRLLHPRPLEVLGVGIALTATASAVNFLVARVLMAQGRKRDSITLEADGQHLMTDVWTSAAVITGLTIGVLTGLQVLDSILALLVGVNVIWTGLVLVSRSISGLMDTSLSRRDKAAIEAVIAQYRLRGVDFHALRTRLAASRRFVSVHILVPGAWSVHDAHHVAEDFENDIRTALGAANVFTHIEPQEDELSMDDVPLDR